MHLEAGRGPRQGGDVGCIPADPEGRVCPSYRAGGGPSPKVDGGPPRNPFAFPRFPFSFRPQRGILWHVRPQRCGQGGGAA